ncbi:LOW QUALITY PROTEIN: hypothetical protein HID58_013007 [Brassica napus]|uniref:Uncharacterized protein n=1 Tax=Brassica napus TaxID=3708 RepID=A0ABQ8E5F0_BRANA|nr:LOW QUALITY PROTEIN: hypothetical protein HID58_013007 [Brassica napus]
MKFPLNNFLDILGECSQEHNQRPFTGVSTCNALTLRLESYRSEPKIVLATSINPKIVGGRLFLSLTSGTHIYFDTETALGKEKFDKLYWHLISSFFDCLLPLNNPYQTELMAQSRRRRRQSLKDLKAFAEAIDVVRDKGVAMAVAVASAEDIDAANVHVQTFSEVKKAL